MKAFLTDIEQDALDNENFRKVLFTGRHSQLVVMSLAPGEEIGTETHGKVDQFFRVESGRGKLVLKGETLALKAGSGLVIPAGTEHNIVNVSKTRPLKLYTIYAPPNHPAGTIHKSKAEAEAAEKAKHG